jgi:hypothetical protein
VIKTLRDAASDSFHQRLTAAATIGAIALAKRVHG